MLKMLIADDEPMALVSAEHAFLCRLFDAPMKSADSFEAFQILRSRRIDLCVIDIRMPGMTGLEIMEACGKEGIKTEFIILSGYSDFSYAQKAMSHGALDYCLKPIDDDEAQKILGRLGQRFIERRKKSDGAVLAQILSGNTEILPYYGIPSRGECAVCVRSSHEGGAGASFFLEDRVITIAEPDGIKGGSVCVTPADKLPQAVAAAVNMRLEDIDGGRGFLSERYINESFLKLKNEVETNACGNINLTELAKKYALNYNYCSELFRKTTGKSFSEFLTEKRMERAAWLLVNSGISVTSVAMEAGYSDYHYFANVFKNYFGTTPTEFRRQGGKTVP